MTRLAQHVNWRGAVSIAAFILLWTALSHLKAPGFAQIPDPAAVGRAFWDKYLPSAVNTLVGGRGHELMLAVGVIEIVAGIGVALKPRIFAYVVAAWLWIIVLNLVLVGGYLDIALRDVGLSLGALALARLSASFDAPTR